MNADLYGVDPVTGERTLKIPVITDGQRSSGRTVLGYFLAAVAFGLYWHFRAR